MSLVTGGRRSTLNPNAPLFIPAAMRRVDDFSPEWWDLVTTSTSFRDYWLSQHPGEDLFGGERDDSFDGNVIGLLPDNIDLDVDEDILNMEAQFEEFLHSSEAEYGIKAGRVIGNGIASEFIRCHKPGFDKKSDALVQIMNMSKQRGPNSPRESMKYWEKPAKNVGSKYSPRFIQQPR